MAQSKETQENVRKAKELWDRKQDTKFVLVREQIARTALRTPEQIEAQKVHKIKQKERRAK